MIELQEEMDATKRGITSSNGAASSPYGTSTGAGAEAGFTPNNTLASGGVLPAPQANLLDYVVGVLRRSDSHEVAPLTAAQVRSGSAGARTQEALHTRKTGRLSWQASTPASDAGYCAACQNQPLWLGTTPSHSSWAWTDSDWMPGRECLQDRPASPGMLEVVAVQQGLAQQVARLAEEVTRLRSRHSRRSGDGDHTLLSRKPLSGYT